LRNAEIHNSPQAGDPLYLAVVALLQVFHQIHPLLVSLGHFDSSASGFSLDLEGGQRASVPIRRLRHCVERLQLGIPSARRFRLGACRPRPR
jgi:hypothetical protein